MTGWMKCPDCGERFAYEAEHYCSTTVGSKPEVSPILIAAAPDMLEALEELVMGGECYCLDLPERIARGVCGWCMAKDAIHKAKGEA